MMGCNILLFTNSNCERKMKRHKIITNKAMNTDFEPLNDIMFCVLKIIYNACCGYIIT